MTSGLKDDKIIIAEKFQNVNRTAEFLQIEPPCSVGATSGRPRAFNERPYNNKKPCIAELFVYRNNRRKAVIISLRTEVHDERL